MPSCVIRCCKNYSASKKKRQGITFHLFPKNESQLNDWINIVQESRDQKDWKPSKASVVCSIHFETDAFYTTKNGLVRVVANAVPRLFLKEPPRTQQQPTPEPNLNRTFLEFQLIKLEQPWTQQQPSAEPNLNRPLQEFQLIKLEQPWTQQPAAEPNSDRPLQELIKSEQPCTQQQPADEPSSDRPLQVLIKSEQPWTQQQPTDEPDSDRPLQVLIKSEQPWTQQQPADEPSSDRPLQVLIKSEQPWTQEQPIDEPDSNRSLQLDKLEQPSTHDDVEQPLSMLSIPRIRHMQRTITHKDEIIKNKNKSIKALNQKIRRLQNRNKSLKNILTNLKTNFFIDTDLFGKLNEDIIAVNLFNNYNRKKLKKNIKYTPDFINFCVTLNDYSPKAYDYVRDTFNTCLPHRKTLAKWHRDVNAEPGFAEESFQALEVNAQVSQHRSLCSLMFDEVAIEPQTNNGMEENISD